MTVYLNASLVKSPRMILIRGFFRRNGKEAVTVLLTMFGK